MEYQIKQNDGKTATVRKNATDRWEIVTSTGFVVGLDNDEAKATLIPVIGAAAATALFPMVGFHA